MSAYLVLETQEIFPGVWHGGQDRAGEVVFNTSHSGYEEIATDPSYFSQIVVMTAPMMGNYGVSDRFWESRKIWIEGFVCLQIQESHRDISWKQRLVEAKVPLVSEMDTRALAKRLRSGGTPWGALVQADSEEQAKSKAEKLIQEAKAKPKDWVWAVSRKESQVVKGTAKNDLKIALLDFGCKENIIRQLQLHFSEIKIFNSRVSIAEIENYQPHALMLSNGPGDPADVQVAPQTIQHFLGKKPIFGICMGHQVLALSMGAKTYKLKFGHRGANHPIKDDLLQRVYISSQNHGYAVDGSTLPQTMTPSQVNLNDNTLAGFYSDKLRCLGIQYHPESCPGPHDAQELFTYFVKKMVL